jgi:dephospho-CoA kinase
LYEGKPIIGLVGGIAAGKSHVAKLFGRAGAEVISSDALVHTAYTHPQIKRQVLEMLGEDAFDPLGNVDRTAVGQMVFRDVEKRKKLERLLHPIVNEVRLQRMQRAAADAAVRAYVWDSPLLMETGLDKLCDAVVFVETDEATRRARAAERGWDAAELARRENLQAPLDKKRARADHVLRGTARVADEATARTHSSPDPSDPRPTADGGGRAQTTPRDDALAWEVGQLLDRILAAPRPAGGRCQNCACGPGPCGDAPGGPASA